MDTAKLGADLLATLHEKGWSIQRTAASEPLLPPDVQARYPRLPMELTSFLAAIESCVNAEETVWFLSREDYQRTDGEAFRWNEFELMILEGEAEAALQQQVLGFWDRHFPFMLAVHSDYDYLAVSLDERSYGQIVHGCGPSFDETSTVAPSFAEFLTLLKETAAGRRNDYPLSYFV
jgi:hypothetical protein